VAADFQISVSLPAWTEKPETLRKPLLEGAQRAMTNTLVKHFRSKDRSEPNAKGWTRSHWWNRVATSVTSRIEGESAVADIREPGVLLHWKGGTVKPKNGHKALAIPADSSVQGIWPSEHGREDTFLAWPKGKSFGFIAKKGEKPLHVLWWLTGATHHEADPSVIPEDALVKGVAKAAQAVCKALARGGAA
jgi:hypothetical protein